jgi:hypothetical protein
MTRRLLSVPVLGADLVRGVVRDGLYPDREHSIYESHVLTIEQENTTAQLHSKCSIHYTEP